MRRSSPVSRLPLKGAVRREASRQAGLRDQWCVHTQQMSTDGDVYPWLSWPDGAVSGWNGTPWVLCPPRGGPAA
jgi:hypothetical protein